MTKVTKKSVSTSTLPDALDDIMSLHSHDSHDNEQGSGTWRYGDDANQGTSAQNHNAQEANSDVSPHTPTAGPQNDLDGGTYTNDGRGKL
jgi:hypothetical protein